MPGKLAQGHLVLCNKHVFSGFKSVTVIRREGLESRRERRKLYGEKSVPKALENYVN